MSQVWEKMQNVPISKLLSCTVRFKWRWTYRSRRRPPRYNSQTLWWWAGVLTCPVLVAYVFMEIRSSAVSVRITRPVIAYPYGQIHSKRTLRWSPFCLEKYFHPLVLKEKSAVEEILTTTKIKLLPCNLYNKVASIINYDLYVLEAQNI